MSELEGYVFESPLLVTSQRVENLPADAWRSGEKWLDSLKGRTDILGIVLPLELKASDYHPRQDLLGVELLNWLRWSAEDPLRYVPVLTVAWQPLAAVLQRTLNLVLVIQGNTFIPLPEAVTKLPQFVDGVRGKHPSWPQARPGDLRRIAGSTQAEQISYHDLANEYYGALRLWEGYKYVLETVTTKREAKQIKQEWKRVESKPMSFAKDMERKLNRPAVREYLESRHQQANPIYYPLVKDPDDLIRNHVKHGLPDDIRILMVDDEFEKGLAEVLVNMLFKASHFSFQLDDEWVYSENGRARLVCVKSIREAAFWLKHWGEVDTIDALKFEEQERYQWIEHWADQLGRNLTSMEHDQLDDMISEVLGVADTLGQIVDRPPVHGHKSATVVLLDLHLDKNETSARYEPGQMASVRLWRKIKGGNDQLPILIFTASRQSMNYAAIMEEAGSSDGWLTKEGPDITVSDAFSSQAALYLLERLRMFSVRGDWYRSEFRWKPEYIEAYSNAYKSSQWKQCEDNVSSEATRIYQNSCDLCNPKYTFSYNLDKLFQYKYFPVEKELVRRRVLIAALFASMTWEKGLVEANVDEFVRRLNCHPKDSPPQKPYNVVNFNETCWFASSQPHKLIGLLLKEEREWMKQTFPAAQFPQIHAFLSTDE